MVVGLFYTVSDIMLQYGVEHVHDLAVVDHLLVEIVAHTQFNQSLQDQVQQLHRLMADVCVEMLAKEGNRNSSNSRCTAHACIHTLVFIHMEHTHSTCAKLATSPTRSMVKRLSFCSRR